MGYNIIFERMNIFHNTSFGFLLRDIRIIFFLKKKKKNEIA